MYLFAYKKGSGFWTDGWWIELDRKSWFVRTFYQGWGGTTLGHGGWYREGKTKGPEIDTGIERHEHVHVEQFEASMLDSFITGVFVFLSCFFYECTILGIWIGGIIWLTGYLRMALSRWIQAWIRGEDMYRGSAHEEAAYAIVEEYERRKRGI